MRELTKSISRAWILERKDSDVEGDSWAVVLQVGIRARYWGEVFISNKGCGKLTLSSF